MARVWTCRKCGYQNARKYAVCQALVCAERRGRRPKPRVPKHRAILSSLPYEQWVERYGERCGICGREPSETRRLDRDHDHKTGEPRGLLCHACNRRLWNGATVEWCLNAAKYLDAGL
jgi:hypothetical protein